MDLVLIGVAFCFFIMQLFLGYLLFHKNESKQNLQFSQFQNSCKEMLMEQRHLAEKRHTENLKILQESILGFQNDTRTQLKNND